MQFYNDEISFSQIRNARSNAKKIDRCKTSGSGSSIGLSEETYNHECILSRDGYSIRSVNSSLHRSAVSALLQRMYSWRGYHTSSEEMYVNNSNWMTFEVSSQQQLVGTLTLGIDGEEGLLADKLHKDEINNFRKKKRKVCELSKFAIDSQYGSKEVLASLFHLSYIYARSLHNADDAFIEVNPRHASFYKRMLGFRQISGINTCERVDAPAVLMHLDLEYVDAKIASLADPYKYKDRSLYPYFFSRHEEEGLAATLRRHIN